VPWLELARAEREDFAAFLETLTPQQWEAPTLCDKTRSSGRINASRFAAGTRAWSG